MIVSKKKLAEIFGKSTTTIDRWMENGMPYQPAEGRGKANKYDTAECIEWYAISKGRKLDYMEERTRLTKLQADKQEMELQLMQGELLKADEVIKKWSDIFNQIRTNLMAIPTRAATLLQGAGTKKEAKNVIENLLRETLDKIANKY